MINHFNTNPNLIKYRIYVIPYLICIINVLSCALSSCSILINSYPSPGAKPQDFPSKLVNS